jgi:hypothetical protein
MRTIYDDDLLEWEAWAVPARGGLPSPGRIVFHCRTDSGLRARFRAVPEGREEAEAMLERAGQEELKRLFADAEPLP